jgi:hypothetical protein
LRQPASLTPSGQRPLGRHCLAQYGQPGPGLKEPSQDLLFGRETVSDESFVGGLQAAAPARLNALLQNAVIEVTLCAEHRDCSAFLNVVRLAVGLVGERWHSNALPRFDMAADRGVRNSADDRCEITSALRRRQSGPQRPEFLSQIAAGTAFEPIDDLGDAKGGVGCHEPVHAARHHLDRMKLYATLGGDFCDQSHTSVHRRCKHRTPIFGAPHDAVLERKGRSGVFGLARLGRAKAYILARKIIQQPDLFSRPALRCRPKATVPCRRF